jgi:hypothetical protein
MAETAPVKKRRKRRVNKSALIREYMTNHPEMGPTAISEELAKQKIRASPAYVSDIKAKMKTGAAPGKPGRKKKTGAASDSSPSQDMAQAGSLMLNAIDLVMKAGYKEARSMIDMANKMVDRVRENGK